MVDPVVWHLIEGVSTGRLDLSTYDGSRLASINLSWRLAALRREYDRQKQFGHLIQAATIQASSYVDAASAESTARQAASMYASLLEPGMAPTLNGQDPVRLLALLYLMHARDKLGIDEPGQSTTKDTTESGTASSTGEADKLYPGV